MERGERERCRTKSAIKNALILIVKNKNYNDITVKDIVDEANVGRSTLYKHYPSKAHIMLGIHEDMFNLLFDDLTTSENWLRTEPQPHLVSFLNRSRQLGNNRFFMSYKLGNDLDFLLTNVNMLMSKILQERLNQAFPTTSFNIPSQIVAISIASIYKDLLLAWFTKFSATSPNEYAHYISQLRSHLIVSVHQ